MRRGLIQSLCLGVLLLGCADTARFELALLLPPTEPSHPFVLFEGRTIDPDNRPDYTEIWDRAHAAEGAELVSATSMAVFAVEADGAEIEQALSVKVRFCSSADCAGDTGPVRRETWIQVERPFYAGEITFYEHSIPTIPAEVDLYAPPGTFDITIVPVCEVGCGTGITDNYCLVQDGRQIHACDPNETTVE